MTKLSTIHQVAVSLIGFFVRLKLDDGRTCYGRIEAVDEANVYLARAQPRTARTTELSWVSEIHPYRESDAPKSV